MIFFSSQWLSRTSIQRIVITASGATILEIHPTPKVYSELNWNEQSIREIEEQGTNASNSAKYMASKTLAERGTSV